LKIVGCKSGVKWDEVRIISMRNILKMKINLSIFLLLLDWFLDGSKIALLENDSGIQWNSVTVIELNKS
jgi:hypothetical protein